MSKDESTYDFDRGYELMARQLMDALRVDTGHWQAVENVPMTQTRELRGVLLKYDIPVSVEELQAEIKPNLPWAENHFYERISGTPLNPGAQYKKWPWYQGNVENHKPEGKFSHTYMERYWPTQAGSLHDGQSINGIRFRYGNLWDVVNLLARQPYTRQAYLPVWFPEDTGAHHRQRVPCSLGYHFIQREGKLHCFYSMRSCDFVRYLRDDIYLTSRLVQWLIHMVGHYSDEAKTDWLDVKPGELSMTISSLHIFEGDIPKLMREYGDGHMPLPERHTNPTLLERPEQ